MSNRILLISPASPFSPQSGAQQRTALLYEALQKLGDVDVLLLEPTPGPSRLEPPKPGILAHGYWHQRSFGIGKFKPDRVLTQALKTEGLDLGYYRLIVSRYLNPISKLHIPPHVSTVVDLDDWNYLYTKEILPAARLKSTYSAWLAQRQLNRFDAFFFVSHIDQARHPELQAAILPNIPFNRPILPFPQTDSSILLFVGSLWYAPNREGIDHFLARCWPAIKVARPEAMLQLVGAAPLAMRQAWERHPGVTAPGFVVDLDDVYRKAAFTIAPIYSGGGTNIKILESLAYGRACVTTPHGAGAFQEDLAGAGLSIGRNAALFSQLCIDWLGAINDRGHLVEKGRALLDQRYTRDLFVDRVTQLCAPYSCSLPATR